MVYLDHSATSYPVRYFAKDYYVPGNPNSQHNAGIKANRALNEARDRIKKCLGVKSGKVLFCRCATEAVEWLCSCFNGPYVSTLKTNCSVYEHDSVRDCCYNIWSFNDAINSMSPNSIYLHQHTNQLTGVVFPIESIGKQVQSAGVFFGSDLTASISHYKLPDNLDSFCSAVWFSGHKFGCEPGIGAIWLSDRLFKYLAGSEDNHNEYNLLHGTPNVSAAVAMSYAMEHAIGHAEDNNKRYLKLASHLFDKLINEHNIPATLVGQDQPKTHAINAVYLPGFNSDSLTQFLSSRDIYVSPCHSACSEKTDYRTALAFGMTKKEAIQSLRISFSEDTCVNDIDVLIDGIVEFKKMFL